MVIAELLGAPVDDWRRLRAWSDAMMALANTVAAGPEAERAVARFRAAHAEMRDYLVPLLAHRRAAPADDLLTRLTAAEVDGEWLTDDEILAFFQLLLFAGHETTTNLLDNAVLAFHEHPEQLARLRATPQLLPSAIEEVLRYRSPVQATFRVAMHDVTLHGQTIPARALVLAMIGSANRDPRQFGDAERFDVGREPNLHVAFGHGIHFCVGAPLARLEARVALPMLLEHLGEFAPATEGWEPREAFHVLGPSRLPLRFAPRRTVTVP
jgi:cytochrome P450